MTISLAPSSTVTSRDPKGTKFFSIIEAAYNKAGLSEGEAQRVNEASGLGDLITTFIAENRLSDKYKDEETKSKYGYPKGYKAKDMGEQLKLICDLLGVTFRNGVNFSFVERPLAQGAEANFAIPRWQLIAPTYCEAFDKVLAAIAKQRKFTNYRAGQLGPDRLRLNERTAQFLEKIGTEQGDHDVLVISAQFGLRHRGRSVRRAREVFLENEFGLDPFTVGIMMLTHPERLVAYDDLGPDCAGGDFDDPDGSTRWSFAPYFDFGGSRLYFDAGKVDFVYDYYGSASGFSPQ